MSATPSPKSQNQITRKTSFRPKRMMSLSGRNAMRSRSPRRRNSLTDRGLNGKKKSHSVWTPQARKSNWGGKSSPFFPKEDDLEEADKKKSTPKLPTALEIFKDALASRTRISADDVISTPMLGKHEPFNVNNLQGDGDHEEKVTEYLKKISEASSHLNYRSRCAIQHSLDECKSQRRLETKRGKLALQHEPREQDVERVRKLASQKDRTGAELEFLAMFLESCCERDSLLSRFAMRSSSEKQSHMKRIFKSWASHVEVDTSLGMLQKTQQQDKSTVDQYVFFLVTNGISGYDDLGFMICSIPRYSIVSNFGSHVRGLKQKSLRVEWSRASKKITPFMLRLHRSIFSASFAEMRHLSHLRTAHSWVHALGWACTWGSTVSFLLYLQYSLVSLTRTQVRVHVFSKTVLRL